ncbi:MAG: hypothetical protein ACJ8EY_01140 [Sphingomicrobium sp.]
MSSNPPEAILSRWMRPSVARSWIAQVRRYSRHPSTRCRLDEGEATFRTLLSRGWVTLDLAGAGARRSP